MKAAATGKPGAWYHKLEVKVKDELRLCEPFDLASYINKLLAPAVHISCLIKTARKPKFKDIFNLPLHVLEVHTYLHYTPSNPPNPPSKEDIRSFLARCYGRCPPDYDDDYDEDEDEAIASDVLDMKLVEVLSAFESCSTLNIKPTHCETTLVHHHLSHEEESPIPYIAVSKPSCLNCGLYLAACGNYWMQKRRYEKGRFQTHGCCGEVTPLLALPSGSATAELDAFVKDDILEKVVNFAAAALRHSLQVERIRRMPQRRNSLHGLFMSLHTEDTGPQDIENAPSQPEQ